MTPEQWQTALSHGVFEGAPVDLADGYIHFSTQGQVVETAQKHFRGQGPLLLLVFDAGDFGGELKWEPSRGGDLFPHLYATLDPGRCIGMHDLTQNSDGSHTFPEIF